MKIIILAAGKGTRAFPLTKNTPKPLLDIGHGQTLIEKQLENIQKSKAIDEGQAIVEQAKIVIEKAIKEIREKSAEKIVIKSAREELRKIEDQFVHLKNEILQDEVAEQELKIGDIVSLKGTDSIGEIVEQVDSNHFVILAGAFRINVGRLDITKSEQKLPTGKRCTSTDSLPAAEPIKNEIDLRGMYAEEAITCIEKFFDNAIIAGFHRVSLIHGKGTGALRRKITEYLRTKASIKSFKLGEWNEGGAGVTIVEL